MQLRSHATCLLTLAIAACGGTAGGGGAASAGPEPATSPGTEVEATYYACVACHSEMIVAQQGLTRDEWDKLFEWMVEEQGMQPLAADRRDIVLDYLSVHFNEDRRR